MLVNYKEERTAEDERFFYHADYLQNQNSVMLFRNSSISKQLDLQSKEKLFKCPVCTKFFNQNYNLVIHKRVHTGEKPCDCSLCKKTFRSSSSLWLHTRVHTRQKPFRCTLSQKTHTKSQRGKTI